MLDNFIGDSGAIELAKSIKRNVSLKELFLDGNKVS